MDEFEFHRLLEHFAVVRTRDYDLETEMKLSASLSSRNLEASKSGKNLTSSKSSRNIEASKSSRNLDSSKSSKKLNPSKSSRNFTPSRSSRNLTPSRSSRKLTSKSLRELVEKMNKAEIDSNDSFWDKLKQAAEKQVGEEEAEKFCKAFQEVYKKLVYEELSLDAARKFLRSSP
ncbi:PREDICTED: uncharacterized protein LOC109166992 isoform X2 [Ipomoea nil]|uniref:uncharacterized protein LOC109166992 isoform X2 n=1 Tax=Ipomoea nil TaxID=35883 RepID=UPI0009014FBC|nr:PREDICTED: uncharacterized protein LOC109166992 isoform X2 [Ipomoea nil]